MFESQEVVEYYYTWNQKYSRERKFMQKDLHWSYLFHTNFNISVKNLRQETEIDNFIIGLWYS